MVRLSVKLGLGIAFQLFSEVRPCHDLIGFRLRLGLRLVVGLGLGSVLGTRLRLGLGPASEIGLGLE